MKKSIFTIVLALVMGITSAFAGNSEGVSQKVMNVFKKDFTAATEVKWEITKDYYKATFKNVDQVMYAYYNSEGTRLAVIRNIRTSQLPIKVQDDMKKFQADHWITDLFEYASTTESGYFVTLENADEKIVLKSSEGTGWIVFSKEEKKD